jgi:preprotein translocase subunit SecG
MQLTLLYVILFFALALLAAILISAECKAIDRKKREKRAEQIRERLRDQV